MVVSSVVSVSANVAVMLWKYFPSPCPGPVLMLGRAASVCIPPAIRPGSGHVVMLQCCNLIAGTTQHCSDAHCRADLARGKLTNVSHCQHQHQHSAGLQITRHLVAPGPVSPPTSRRTYLLYTQWELQVISSIQRERDIERCVECVGS